MVHCIVNFIPIALRIDWRVFDILLDDDKIVDFTAIYGDDFPLLGNVLASKDYSEDAITPRTGSSRSIEALSSSQEEGNSVMENSARRIEGEEREDTMVLPGQEDLIRVLLEPHEGRETVGCTYNIRPKQMVPTNSKFYTITHNNAK